MKKPYSSIAIMGLVLGMPGAQAREIPGHELPDHPSSASRQGLQGKAQVTYVANEGFLIRTGNKKILVDALFGGIEADWCEQPGDSLLGLMVNGQPPFDNIDAVLVSHYHADHFNEKILSEFMVKNASAILVCPDQANQLLKRNASYNLFSERVRVVHSPGHRDTSTVSGDIKIMALPIRHSAYYEKDTVTGELRDRHKDVENLAYVVTADSCTFFHSGDASVKEFEDNKEILPGSETVDLALMDREFMQPAGMNIINRIVRPGKLIFMHIEPSGVEYYRNIMKDFPDILIFREPLEAVVL